jgi:hypothetical protein
MRFELFSVAALLLGSVVASPVENDATKDAAYLETYLKKMSSDLAIIKSTIRALPSGGDATVANRESQRLLNLLITNNQDVQNGAREIRRGPVLRDYAITELTTLQSQLRDVMSGLITENTKRMIWTAGKQAAQDRFYQEIRASSDAARELGDAMTSKASSIIVTAYGSSVGLPNCVFDAKELFHSYFETNEFCQSCRWSPDSCTTWNRLKNFDFILHP